MMDIWNGQNRATGLQNEAAGTLASGQAQQTGSYYRAGGSLLSGLGGMYRKYGYTNPGGYDNYDPTMPS